MWMKKCPIDDVIIALYKDLTLNNSAPTSEKIKAILDHVANLDLETEMKELFVFHYKDCAGKFEAFSNCVNEIMEEESAMIPDEKCCPSTVPHRAPTFVSMAHLLRKGIERLTKTHTCKATFYSRSIAVIVRC